MCVSYMDVPRHAGALPKLIAPRVPFCKSANSSFAFYCRFGFRSRFKENNGVRCCKPSPVFVFLAR